MNRSNLILFLSLFSIFPLNLASSAVISRDWKTPGDGLLTYDTVNNREWLDLSQTLLSDQFPGTGIGILDTRESRYQYVVSQTAPGGLFQGFRVARSQQVIGLAESAGIDTTGIDIGILSESNVAATLNLGNLLGFTLEPINGNKFAIGLIDEIDSDFSFSIRRNAQFVVLVQTQSVAGLGIGIGHSDMRTPPGVMLYRAIPEPSALLLIISALAGSQRFLRRAI